MNNVIEVDVDSLFDQQHILRKQSIDVDISQFVSISNIVEEMKTAILTSNHATGISAIQLGIPLRIFVINMSRISGEEIVAINPEIVTISGRIQERLEGCLSLPNYSGKVKRRNKVSFTAYDLDKTIRSYQFIGYASAVVQHEFDHLDGILYWDRMEKGSIPTKRESPTEV